jgi:hypothetical protein
MGVGPIQTVTAAHGLLAGWSDRGPLNQYARSNYRADQSWVTWRNADCTAAALDWLLGAYGQQLARRSRQIVAVLPVCPHAVLPRRQPGCHGPGSQRIMLADCDAVRVIGCSLLCGDPAQSK